MLDWNLQGCEACRHAVLSGLGNPLSRLAVSDAYHAYLHRCDKCQSLWIENEREVHIIETSEARAVFGDNAIQD